MVPVALTRAALAALADAGPAERPAAFSALTDACNGLDAWIGQCRAWLDKEKGALDELWQDGMGEADSAFLERLAKYERNWKTYEASKALLTEAVMAAKEG